MRHARPGLCSAVIATLTLAVIALSAQPVSAATCQWNVALGNWNDAGNWTCGSVPGAGDTVVISNNGTVTATTDVSVAILNLSAGTITGPGALTVTNGFNWSGGTLTSTVAGTPVVLAPGSALAISGNVNMYGRALTNHGTALWTAGYPYVSNAAVFNNAASGTLTMATPASEFWQTGNTGFLNNAGTIVKTGAGETALYVALNNSGYVTLTAGTLKLLKDGTSSGSFAVPAGTALSFAGGTNVLDASATVKGAGTVIASGGTAVISGTYNVSNTVASAGSLTLAPGQSLLLDQVTLGVATLALSSGHGATINRLTMTGGTLTGSDPLTVTNWYNWSGGSITSTVAGTPVVLAPGNALTISGNVNVYGRPLTNYGTALWTAGYPYLSNAAVFNNAASGTLTMATPASEFWQTGNTGFLNNAGTIVKTGAGETAFYTSLNNNGIFTLTAGTVALRANGASSGSIAVPAGTALNFGGGTNVLDGSATVKGAGTVIASGGTAVISGTYNLSKTVVSAGELRLSSGLGIVLNELTVSFGTLGGTSPLTVATSFNWSGGTLTSTVGATPMTLLSSGVMTMASGTLNGREFVNHGSAVWTAGNMYLQNAATFVNAPSGSLNLAASAGEFFYTSSGGSFNNAGTVTRSVAPAVPWNVPILNTGNVILTGTVLQMDATYTQTAGLTSLSNAAIVKTVGPVALLGGQLRGTGVITGSLRHEGGTVAPGSSAGILKVAGNYTQFSGGTLQIELGGLTSGTQYDLLDVTGSASLGGPLNIQLINGFLPAAGNTFRVLNYGSHTGAFAPVTGGNLGPGSVLGPLYFADNVTLLFVKQLFLPILVR